MSVRRMQSAARCLRLLVVLSLTLLTPAALPAEDELLAETANTLAGACVERPPDLHALFGDGFLKSVPWDEIQKLLAKLHSENGPVVAVEAGEKDSKLSGKFRFVFAKKSVVPVSLTLSGTPPRIGGLWFGPASPLEDSLARIVQDARALHGRASLCVMELGDQTRILAQLEPGLPLAIGSAFKLYILGGLIEAVEGGSLRWDQAIPLEDRWTSLPSGVLQGWPEGTPVTVATLAAQMLSISDNTATDHLLFLLGRERVESMLGKMGVAKPAGMLPFLSTLEMFLLKRLGGEKTAATYVEADVATRRRLLERLERVPRDEVRLDKAPRLIDRIEWFASTSDLCRTMDWLRRETDKPASALARALLAINPGVPHRAEVWPYVGYKGGSEAGVLNLTLLLERSDRRWFAASATWNDPGKSLDASKLPMLMARLMTVLEESERAPYYRVFRGYRRADVPAAEFSRVLSEKFVPALPRALAGKGLTAYLPALPPAGATTGTPDEIALVAYQSEAIYQSLGTLPEGKAYQALHWDFFDKERTRTGGAVPFLGELTAEVPVDVLNRPVDWQAGHTAVFVGARQASVLPRQFLEQLSKHVELVKNAFAGKGLDGYLVAANEDREVAWLHWSSKEAMGAAMAAPEGVRVQADAGRLMTTVMWSEAVPFQGSLEPGQAVNVLFDRTPVPTESPRRHPSGRSRLQPVEPGE